jgi:uncharacterized protein YggE
VPDQPQLTVVGTGIATGTPDQCQLQIGLSVTTDDVAVALSTCAELASKAIVAIGEVDGAQCDVQTAGISVQDFFDKSQMRVTAKAATYELRITVRALDGVGSILTALGAVAGDALAVRGFYLGVRDPEPLRREARRLAVEDARRRAVELSAAAGVRLGSLLALQDSAGSHASPPGRVTTMAFAAAAPSVPVEPGEVSASSVITMTYAILPEAPPT